LPALMAETVGAHDFTRPPLTVMLLTAHI